MKANQIYHCDGEQKLKNPKHEIYASLFLPGFLMCWTEGSGAGNALVKCKEHGWAAAVYCQLVALHEHLS